MIYSYGKHINIMSTLGEKISTIRKSKGLSQEKLAEDASINLRTLQRIEKGDTRPHGETLKRICKALDVPVEDINGQHSGRAISFINIMTYLLVFVLAGILIYGQLGQSGKSSGKLITKRIHYEIPIGLTDLGYLWINNIPKPERVEFVKDLFDRAFSGKVKTCDIYMNPIGPEELKAQLADSLFMILMKQVPPYEEFDTCILRPVDPEDVDYLGFQEEWTYNADDMVIEKRVLGICPIIMENKLHRIINRPLFWVYFDDIILEKK